MTEVSADSWNCRNPLWNHQDAKARSANHTVEQKEIPPMTGPDRAIKVDSLPIKSIRWKNAAPAISARCKLLVTAMTPIFSPGGSRNRAIHPDSIVEKLSPNKERWSPGSFKKIAAHYLAGH